MVTKLRIRNLKSLADSGELSIRPLTFLLGPNSAGKSSILQSLLLLRQTVDSRDLKTPLGINGPYVRLGSYPELIFMHNYREHLGFALELSTGSRGFFLPVPLGGRETERYETIWFDVEFSYNKKTMQVVLERSSFVLRPNGSVFEIRRTPKGYQAILDIESDNGKQSYVTRVSELQKFYSGRIFGVAGRAKPTTQTLRANRNITFTASILAREIEEAFGHVFYIGPLREWPQRVYVATGGAPQDVGLKGELSVDVLWVQSRSKKTREKLLGKVNKWMQEFGISSEVKLRQLSGNTYCVELIDPHTQLRVNVLDVGFGASQVFPIVVEGFYAPPNAMVLIEQPEIHLHPKAQGTVGDLLIDIVKAENKTLLIETHSEHLISRVRRRIAEGKIARDDVAIYYCHASPSGTQVTEIRLNELGQFEGEGLPEGFLEEGFTESMEHFKAMVDTTNKS